MSNIRGKLRQQYIDNWLEGHEDPDVEVKPTRIDGKYIVRQRRASSEAEVRARVPSNPSPTNPSPINTVADTEDQKPKFEEKDISSNDAENNSKVRGTRASSEAEDPITENNSKAAENNSKASLPENDIMEEILKQLKIINDERQAKQIKKAKKKELQQAIRKEFVRHRVIVEDPEPIQFPDPEPQTVYIEKTPIRMRRRLDLRNKR